MKLQGKKVLVTGAGSGIGRALALELGEAGCRLLLLGRRAEPLERLAGELPRSQVLLADLARGEDLRDLLDLLRREHSDLDLLVNNAGVQKAWSVGELFSLEGLFEELQVNLAAPLALTAGLLPQLSERPQAGVVQMLSALVIAPKSSAPVYCATKSGLQGFDRALRRHLEAAGVALTEVLPPLVDTAMTAGRGRRKIGPEVVAKAVRRGIERDRSRVLIGPVRVLAVLERLWPAWARRILLDSP